MFLRSIFLFLFSSVVYAEAILIPSDLEAPFSNTLDYPESGYSEPDANLNSMQRLSLLSDSEFMHSSRSSFSKGQFDIWFLKEPFTKYSISPVGEKDEFVYPAQDAPTNITFDNFYLLDEVYIVDKEENTIKRFDENQNLWLDYRDLYTLPDGVIINLYLKDSFLHAIIKTQDTCSVWKFEGLLEKKFEINSCDAQQFSSSYQDGNDDWWWRSIYNRVSTFSSGVVLETQDNLYGMTKSRSLTLQKLESGASKHVLQQETEVDSEEDFSQPEYSFGYSVNQGLLYISSDLKEGGALFYDVEKDTLEPFPYPISAESYRVCNYSMSDLYCLFDMGGDVFAVYKVEHNGFILDSVFDLSLYSDESFQFSVAGAYGDTRLLLLVDKNEHEYLLEASKYHVRVLLKMDSRNGVSLIVAKDGVNYILEYRDGVKMHRYEWDSTQETLPLVEADEFPNYRKMQSLDQDKSDSGKFLGIASLNYYFFFSVLFLLFRLKRRA